MCVYDKLILHNFIIYQLIKEVFEIYIQIATNCLRPPLWKISKVFGQK